MTDLTVTPRGRDFGAAHAALRRYVDGDILAGVSSAVLDGRELIDLHCTGFADREREIPLRVDHLFRAFSNTKLVTTIAVLLLWERGAIGLDDPIERYIPQLGQRCVLRPGAKTLDDTEPARTSITVAHLLSHSAGLSYGLFDPGTTIQKGYSDQRVLNPFATLADMMDALAPLPLIYHPGTNWEYSVATDVVSRLIEVVSGERFDRFIQSKVLGPLGMCDTTFVVPEGQRDRLCAYYLGADMRDPTKPGLKRADDLPYPQAYLRPVARLSGGGGLVTSLPDMIALLRGLLPGGPTILKPDTIARMMTNQLPDGVCIAFAGLGRIDGKGFGLGGSVTLQPSAQEPVDAVGEFQWGGIAGTHWWISPRTGLAGLLMTQRVMAFWNPFTFDFRRAVYQAAAR